MIDRVWASGGCLADLVDRNDVGNLHNTLFLSDLSFSSLLKVQSQKKV